MRSEDDLTGALAAGQNEDIRRDVIQSVRAWASVEAQQWAQRAYRTWAGHNRCLQAHPKSKGPVRVVGSQQESIEFSPLDLTPLNGKENGTRSRASSG